MPFKPVPHQIAISDQAAALLIERRIAYLSMEVRTYKTITSYMTADKIGAKKVLLVSKKKAISSETFQIDYDLLKPSFELTVINYESVHKVDTKDVDTVIIDEAHSIAAYPKPSLRTKKLKQIIGDKYLILLSGTPTPESFSQIYHQFWISNHSPFKESSFYKWAHKFVNIKKKKVAYGNTVNDYSGAIKSLINPVIEPYMISYTQEAAGFKTKVNEEVLTVKMRPSTYELTKRLKRDKVYEGKSGVILCDTPVKMQIKLTQIYSGTIKLEDGTTKILDDSKAKFIKKRFEGKKIGIFYRFIAELELLKQTFGDNLTTEIVEFNATDKNIALQIVSGREGVSLRNAEYLIFFNIDFSATSYWQARDRMTTKDRAFNKVYWIFSEGGIEEQIYKTVQGKKSYTTEHFKRWIK